MTNKPAPILFLPTNIKGRDFVVGDLRGGFDLLAQALDAVFFNPRVDRLFSVGNVIGKAPDLAQCLDFFNKPYFFPVLGYSEVDLINLYDLIGTKKPNYLIRGEHVHKKGLGWWLDIGADLKLAIINKLRALPMVIETITPSGLNVGVMHGEVPIGMNWNTCKAHVQVAVQEQRTLSWLLRGGERMKLDNGSPVSGVDRLFAGHSTVQPEEGGGLPIYGNIVMTDTGAALSSASQCAGLSITDMDLLDTLIIETRRSRQARQKNGSIKLNIPDVVKFFDTRDDVSFPKNPGYGI